MEAGAALGRVLVRVSRLPSLGLGEAAARSDLCCFSWPRPFSSPHPHNHSPYRTSGGVERDLSGGPGFPPLPHLVYPASDRKPRLWGRLLHLYGWWWPARVIFSAGKGVLALLL